MFNLPISGIWYISLPGSFGKEVGKGEECTTQEALNYPLPGLEIEEKTCSPGLKCKCPEPVYSNDGIISASICRCAEKGKECTNPEYRLRNPQIEEKRCDDGFYCKCAGSGPNVINLIPTCECEEGLPPVYESVEIIGRDY